MKVCSVCQRCFSDAAEVCREDGNDEFVNAGHGDPEMISGYILTRLTEVSRNREAYDAQEVTSGSPCLITLFSTAVDADRILLEARTVKATFNSGVVGVYDAGTINDGRVFIVSEVANGQSLRRLVTNVGPPDLLASIEIVRQVAETLHALHENSVTHGAINPENIFLSSGMDGRAQVRIDNIDYGRTVEHAITSNKFEIDLHIGQLRYFAPEQCTGGERTPRSDVYSLGVVFYELLAGEPLFDSAKAVDVIDKHLHERPPEVKINNFELRMLITHALSESLQKQPAFRQSSANAFARQLRHIEQLATHTSTPPPAVKNMRGVAPASPRVEIYPTVPAQFSAQETVKLDPRRAVTPPPAQTKPKPASPKTVEPAALPIVERTNAPAPKPEAEIKLETSPIVVAESLPTVPKRSRLRSLKRKLHTLSAMVTSTIERGTLASITGELANLATKDDTSRTKGPRKIEWVQPEDDIPSVEEVVKALAVDGKTESDIAHVLATPQEQPSSVITLDLVSEAPKVTPVPIVEPSKPVIAKQAEMTEIESPEPAIAKPVKKVKTKPVIAKPVESPKVERVEPVIARLIETPKVERPEPMIATPIETPKVERVEPVIATTIESPKVELPEPVIAEAVETPKPVAPLRQTPVEKAPAKPAVVTAPFSNPVKPKPKPVTPMPVAQVAKPQPKPALAISAQCQTAVVAQPQFADGDEEITLVRPPKSRVRIDLEKPRTIYRAQTAYARSAADISFQPTMIEPRKQKRSRPAPAPEVQDGMFSADFGWSSSLTDVKYRAMTIGVGCFVLAALFLFANDSVSRFFQNVSPGDSSTAQATVSDTVRGTSPAVDPVFKPTRASLRNSSETTAVEPKQIKTADESKPTPKASSDKEKVKETPKTMSKPTQEKPIKRVEAELSKKLPVKRPAFPDLGRPSGATRPRIVKDPRP